MDENEFKLESERLRLEAGVKKDEARQKVRQVIFGTMIVGLAAAAFPFAQKVAESVFQERIERIRKDTEFEILREKNELEERLAQKKHDLESARQAAAFQQERRAFLQSLAEEARSENIERRIVLAEFYSYLASDEERLKWEKFQKFLYDRQKQLSEEHARALATVNDPGADSQDVSIASARIGQIERLQDPEQSQQKSSPDKCDFPLTGIPNADVIVDDLLAGLPFCPTPNKSPGEMRPEFAVISYSGGATLRNEVRLFENRSTRASVHIVIGKDGSAIQMGKFNEKLWHAGRSSWQGRTNFNNFSIGIDLVNSGPLTGVPGNFRTWTGKSVPDNRTIEAAHKNDPGKLRYWEVFTPEQIEATVKILRVIMKTYDIPVENVIGKDDIAPGRKLAPGPAFPWDVIREKLKVD